MSERVAIVGSRFRPCRDDVFDAVSELPADTIIVSGCAVGVDSWAEEAASVFGMEFVGFPPQYPKGATRQQAIAALFDRNTKIAEYCTRCIAFPQEQVDPGRGGTWDTIRKCRKLGKQVDIR